MPSVPAGRSGKTRYRISAVLSQTRISTAPASSVPNSRRMPRGSITARDGGVAEPARESQLRHRRRAVAEQALSVRRIDPGASHHLGAMARADLVLHRVDQGIERSRIHEALLDSRDSSAFVLSARGYSGSSKGTLA